MSYILKKIDSFLNTQTMYRLVFQSLVVLALFSILFGFTGIIFYSGVSLIVSLIILLLSCYVSNYIFAKIVNAPRNYESVFISALILFFLLSPATDMGGYGILVLASVIAMASKYVLAIHKKHIFNPAGISVLLLGLFGSGSAIWWVGTTPLLPIVCIVGFLILRKIDKFKLFFTFAGTAILFILGFALWGGASVWGTFVQAFTSWPLIFFGSIMLTEPLSTPPTTKQQTIYGILVGALFGSQFAFGPVYSTPQLALIVGNIYTYIVSPKYFSKLILQKKEEIASGIYEFIFSSSKKLANLPGQYIEWTLPHTQVDTRGTRRYFTLASSPTEDTVQIGVRVSEKNGSSFKKKLLSMNAGDEIFASGLAGEFILPKDVNQKLVFIAGGIGVTPFRSMIKYLVDTGEKRDITLLYSNKTPNDIAYADVFREAQNKIGVNVVYVINDLTADVSEYPGAIRTIDRETISKTIPDYKDRMFYLSGPPGMVDAFDALLKSMEVDGSQIITDFFPGY